MHLSKFSCFFSFILNRLCAALSSWLITFFTLIRFLNIFRPLNTIKSNFILLTGLLVSFFLANSYSLIVLEYDSDSTTTFNESFIVYQMPCHIRSKYSENRLVLVLNTLIAGVFTLAVPSILILIVNILTINYVKRVYKNQIQTKLTRNIDGTRFRSTGSTVLAISVTYMLFHLPYCIFYFLMISLEDTHNTWHFFSEITYILRYIGHSINFYAYIFTNTRFRREILALMQYILRFRCIKRKNGRRSFTEQRQTPVYPLLARANLRRARANVCTIQK